MMSQCLQDLWVTDPDDDIDRIESAKDTLLKDCYAWILKDQDFQILAKQRRMSTSLDEW
jgi:hypothetical protein